VTDSLTVRRAGVDDVPGIVHLARRALGWTDADARFLEWKHLENPFGVSPMWIALDGARVVGFRTFLLWQFQRGDRVVRAARAVDTATDPDYQGQGIFTRLTLEAVDALPDEGVELIFNTPNDRSRPGYLKMGWREVGRLPVAVLPASLRFPVVVAGARQAAGRWPEVSAAGEAAAEVLGEAEAFGRLLSSQPAAEGLSTRRSPEMLAWRYGLGDLGYRIVLAGSTVDAGCVIFRNRRRGSAVEAVVCDVLVPGAEESVARHLLRALARHAGADYLLRIDERRVTREPFVRLPRVGPVLTCRSLDAVEPPGAAAWALTMGDVELF
jgi:GNAT superfamily N-acetyltransferase